MARGRRVRGVAVSICPTCNTSEDHGDVICCVLCNCWLHYTCADVSPTDSCVTDEGESWDCPHCRMAPNGLTNTTTQPPTTTTNTTNINNNLVDVNAVIVDVDVVTAVVEDPLVNPLVNNVPSTQTSSQSESVSHSQQQSRVVRGVIVGERVDLEPWLDP